MAITPARLKVLRLKAGRLKFVSVTLAVSTGTIPSGASLFGPRLEPVAAHIPTTASAFAPRVAQGVGTAFIASTSLLAAPSVAVSILLPAIGSTAVLFPSVLATATPVGAAHLVSGAGLFAPTVALAVGGGVVLPAVPSSAVLYPPALSVASVAVALPRIGSVVVIFPPGLVAGVGVGGLTTTAVLFDPIVTSGLSVQTVSLPFIQPATGAATLNRGLLNAYRLNQAGVPQAFPPTVTLVAGVVAAHIGSTSLLFAPVGVPPVGAVVVGGLVQPQRLYAPTLLPQVPTEIRAAFIPSGSHLRPPEVAPGARFITTGHVGTLASAHAPALAPEITTPALASSAVLHAPLMVTTGAVTITAGHMPSAARVFPLRLATEIATPFLPSGAVLFGVSLKVGIVAGTVAPTTRLFAPRVAVQAVGATVPSGAALFPPTVALAIVGPTLTNLAGVFPPATATITKVTAGHITSVVALHAPSLQPGLVGAVLPFISSTARLFPLAVAQRILLPPIGSTALAWPPLSVVAGPVEVRLPVIQSRAAVFAPAVAPVVTLPHIVSIASVYPPTVGAGVALPLIDSTARLFLLRVDLTAVGATIFSTARLFPPDVAYEVLAARIPSRAVLFPPVLTPAIVTPEWVVSTVLFPPAYVSTAPQIFEDFESEVCRAIAPTVWVKQRLSVTVSADPVLDAVSEVCRTLRPTVYVLQAQHAFALVTPPLLTNLTSEVRRALDASVGIVRQQSTSARIAPLLEFTVTAQLVESVESEMTEDVLA